MNAGDVGFQQDGATAYTARRSLNISRENGSTDRPNAIADISIDILRIVQIKFRLYQCIDGNEVVSSRCNFTCNPIHRKNN